MSSHLGGEVPGGAGGSEIDTRTRGALIHVFGGAEATGTLALAVTVRRRVSWLALGLAAVGLLGCGSRDEPKSLILITMDTTRADHLGAYGYRQAHTPTIDRLASNGTLFERAYAVTPETLPSHASIFTGLYPPSHSVRLNLVYQLPDEASTLAELLRERGLSTIAVCAASVLDPRFGLDQGFDVYDAPEVPENPSQMLERTAQTVTEKALDYLAERDRDPYFLWAHYYDPHSPFSPRAPFEVSDEVPSESVERYDAEIAYTDHWIGKLLEELEARGDLEDTLVVFMADHGESLGDHGETYHMLFVYDATIHVPLILAGPGVPAGERVEEVVSSLDVFATALRMFGVEPPESSSRELPGVSVAAKNDAPRFAYSDSMTPPLRYGWNALEAIRTRDWLYIRAPDEELYRLDGADPGNEENLFREEPEIGERLRRGLEQALRNMPTTGLEGETRRAPSEAEIRALEALGYVGGLSRETTEAAARNDGEDPKDMVEVAEAIQLASLANRLGKNDTAEELLSWAAEVDPENYGVWVQLGDLRFGEERYPDARIAWEQAASLRPGSWEVLVNLSSAEEALGHPERAELYLAEALETSPFPKEAWRKLARLRVAQKDWNAAEEAFRMVLEIDPEDERAGRALNRLEQRRIGSSPKATASDEHL